MISVDAISTSPTEAINAAILEWWVQSLDPMELFNNFSKIDDASFSGVSDFEVGSQILKIYDYHDDFLIAVHQNPATAFIFSKYGRKADMKHWLQEIIGKKIKQTTAWDVRIKSIKSFMRKNKIVEKVLKT